MEHRVKIEGLPSKASSEDVQAWLKERYQREPSFVSDVADNEAHARYETSEEAEAAAVAADGQLFEGEEVSARASEVEVKPPKRKASALSEAARKAKNLKRRQQRARAQERKRLEAGGAGGNPRGPRPGESGVVSRGLRA